MGIVTPTPTPPP